MLKHLVVQSFAIIDDIQISFEDGLTVLTGETGAGKSLLIDAIFLILGERASSEMIRSGATKALIQAQFDVKNPRVLDVLRSLKASKGSELTIEREISIQNKNRITANGVTISLLELREITQYLADVHSQFDTQRLIQIAQYIPILDGFNQELIDTAKQRYHSELSLYQQQQKEYRQFLARRQELQDKKEMYQYQLEELKRLQLSIDEEALLLQETKWMANFDKIYRELQSIHQLFDESEFMNQFYEIKSTLATLGESFEELKDAATRMNDSYYEMDDLQASISKLIDRLNFDPERLNHMLERLSQLDQIKRKYKKSITELLDYQASIEEHVKQSDHFDDYATEWVKKIKSSHQKTLAAAQDLTQIRHEIAKKVKMELERLFQELVLPNAVFEVAFAHIDTSDVFQGAYFQDHGIDQIDFLITTNPGEPLKPLSKTVSGGEMSRIMLAFKTIFLQSQELDTIVFDEIDTGISGSIAKQIAKKMRSIARDTQVVAISHLPQVVAIAKHHLLVEKVMKHNRVVATARYLTFEERIQIIAEMISGMNPSQAAIESAKELLLAK